MRKKGHMMVIYLKDSDREAIVDFVKGHEELYGKTHEKGQEILSVEKDSQIALSKSVQHLV